MFLAFVVHPAIDVVRAINTYVFSTLHVFFVGHSSSTGSSWLLEFGLKILFVLAFFLVFFQVNRFIRELIWQLQLWSLPHPLQRDPGLCHHRQRSLLRFIWCPRSQGYKDPHAQVKFRVQPIEGKVSEPVAGLDLQCKEAAEAGMSCIFDFLTKNNFKETLAIGDDAPGIFCEIM